MLKIYSFMSFALSKVNRDLSLKEMVRNIIAIAIIGIAVNGLIFSSLNAKSLDEILSDKKIRIGINPNFPNMSADVCSPRSWERVDPHVHLCSKPPLCNACHY